MTTIAAAQGLDWRFADEWLNNMEDESGSNLKKDREHPSSLQSQSEKPGRRLNLLVVEDNLPDALIVREVVEQQHLEFDIHHAADGAQAVEFLSRAERDPLAPSADIVLLDLNLPKVDGFEVLRHIRLSRKHAQVTVIIVTSSDSPADRRNAAEMADGYFRKPADYGEYLKLGDLLKQVVQDKGWL
jgi:CheY-like chemotaxis protein